MAIYTTINCDYCSKKFDRPIKRYEEAISHNWRQFFSLECQWIAKSKEKLCSCENPACSKTFMRSAVDLKKYTHSYCSSSCAAIVNIHKHPKRTIKLKICTICDKQFKSRNKYCSWDCVRKQIVSANQILSKEIILQHIQDFYTEHQRIPIKQEFYNAKAARVYFGTWNKAIIAAGFAPNPVKFAKRLRARDGHVCDSFSEMIIDNWLESHNIPHEIHIPYKRDNMSADFKVGDILIEFVGLEGKVAKYDQSLERKRALWKEKNLNVIEIFPQDLFPKNMLGRILSSILDSNDFGDTI